MSKHAKEFVAEICTVSRAAMEGGSKKTFTVKKKPHRHISLKCAQGKKQNTSFL